jgi:hypothetical protein
MVAEIRRVMPVPPSDLESEPFFSVGLCIVVHGFDVKVKRFSDPDWILICLVRRVWKMV